MKNPMYSEKQMKIISGEIPLESVNGRTALALYNKAVANGDEDLAADALKRLNKAKEEAKANNVERVRSRHRLMKNNQYQWKQPKSDQYTEHQKKIIRGEIPLESVHTKELIHIHLKAKTVGDYELSERIYDLIITRREIAQEKSREHLENLKNRDIPAQKIEKLTKWDQGVLDGIIDLSECPVERLNNIYDIVAKTGTEEEIKHVELLIRIKEHPESLYVTNDRETAIDIIEELLQLPIRRPKTWFNE